MNYMPIVGDTVNTPFGAGKVVEFSQVPYDTIFTIKLNESKKWVVEPGTPREYTGLTEYVALPARQVTKVVHTPEGISTIDEQHIMRTAARIGKIEAIWLVRRLVNVNLQGAKCYVESLQAKPEYQHYVSCVPGY